MRIVLTGALLLTACDNATPTDGPDAAELEGSVYRMQLGGMVIDGADPGAATLVQGAMRPNILMQAFRADATSVDWRLAFGNDDPPLAQDPCSTTTDLPAATLDASVFTIGPVDYGFPASTPWTMRGMVIEGTLSSDLESASDILMSGTLDARELHPLLPAAADADALCSLFGGVDLVCGPCDDQAPYCVDIAVSGLGAERVDVAVESIPAPSCE